MPDHPETRLELNVGHWPDRKRPMLTIYDRQLNTHTVLAHFRSDGAAEEFLDACRMGIKFMEADNA